MNLLQINPIEDSLNQSITMNLVIGNSAKRVMFDLIYKDATDRWYMTLTDVQTKECYFSMVPIVSSRDGFMNDLWSPFAYKGIGKLWCLPKGDYTSTENPSKNNLNEFALIWGDGIE